MRTKHLPDGELRSDDHVDAGGSKVSGKGAADFPERTCLRAQWRRGKTAPTSSMAITVLVVGAAIGCGGSKSRDCDTCNADGGTQSPDGGTQTPDAPSGESGSNTSCPTSEPTEGDVCAVTQVTCTFGDSPRPACRDSWTCVSEAWHATRLGCPTVPAGYCPAQQPDASTCTPNFDLQTRGDCVYPGNVLCSCSCPGTAGMLGSTCSTSNWVCYPPPSTPGCPALLPNLGTPCAVQGTECTYADPCDVDGAVVFCRAGLWDVGDAHCPA